MHTNLPGEEDFSIKVRLAFNQQINLLGWLITIFTCGNGKSRRHGEALPRKCAKMMCKDLEHIEGLPLAPRANRQSPQ